MRPFVPCSLLLLAGLSACSGDAAVEVEPLDLPADPAATGVPVGVRTESHGALTVEIWYPASDRTKGSPEILDFADYIPDSVSTALGGDVQVAPVPTIAVRDAPLRVPDAPYPVIVFSHGFGGNRVQSPDLTAHLASRGYVVIATDHAGRSLGDLLPCMFSPPLEGCNLDGFGEDPAVPHVELLVGFADQAAKQGFFANAIDPTNLGIFGHSAGGGTTTTVLQTNERFKAGLPMAGGGAVDRDVPSLMLAADCDGIVGYDGLRSAAISSPGMDLLTIEGAGHLAFSDLCVLDLEALYDDYLADRDDINATFADLFLGLGIDGCPGHTPPIAECGASWLPLEVSTPIARHYATVFFDAELYGGGAGVSGGVFPEAVFEP